MLLPVSLVREVPQDPDCTPFRMFFLDKEFPYWNSEVKPISGLPKVVGEVETLVLGLSYFSQESLQIRVQCSVDCTALSMH